VNKNQTDLFGSKVTDDWATPEWLYRQLDSEFHFDLDPCPLKSMVNGLDMEWRGNVFVNPPYSQVKKWLVKAHEELKKEAKTIVFLVFVNTDTAWFHDYVYGKAEIRFLRGRVKFVGFSKNGSMRPSMVCIFRREGT
jgi:site-specific DNA-methyltransferase (adenine-specific)